VIQSILVALDDSPRASAVFRSAISLARQLGAEIFIIRVLWVPPDIPPAAHVHPDRVEGILETATREQLRALMSTAPDVRFGAPVVVEGDPWRQILRAGDELAVDLIIMGNHRHHGLERVLGTVAAKVVNHARRDVLVVHANHDSG
jgi:universal stress protein F